MKNSGVILLFVVALSVVIVTGFFVYAGDTLTVEADIFKFREIVSIEVQDFIDLGNVTVGFETDPTSDDKIHVNNTGNLNVTVTPVLVNSSEKIFSYLYFTKRLSGDNFEYKKVGEFSFDIEKPSTIGVVRKEFIYPKLDLRNFTDDIDNDMINHRTNVRFIATAS